MLFKTVTLGNTRGQQPSKITDKISKSSFFAQDFNRDFSQDFMLILLQILADFLIEFNIRKFPKESGKSFYSKISATANKISSLLRTPHGNKELHYVDREICRIDM